MDEIDELGYAAWAEYYHQIKTKTNIKYDERLGYGNNKYYKRFRQIGLMCKTERVDPADYVRVAFTLITDNYRYFTPMDFTNPNLMAAYKRHKAAYGDAHMASWATQVEMITQLTCRLSPDSTTTEEDLLLSGANTFSAWFRLFYLPAFSERIFEAYGKAIWNELAEDPPLRAFLRTSRPRHMDEFEKRIGYFGDIKPGEIMGCSR